MPRILLLLALLPLVGCQARDADLLALACQRAGHKLGITGGPARGTLTGTLRGSLGETSLSARVESRLRWDKALADHPIEASVTGPGTVTLRGTIADATLRQKAVDVAQTTLGVEKVINELAAPRAREGGE
jgi:osmotically-inducible protein OsmY